MADDTQYPPGVVEDSGQEAEPMQDDSNDVEEPAPTREPVRQEVPQVQEAANSPQQPQFSTEQIIQQAEERAFQRMASWQGRRDKDLFDNLGSLIDNRLKVAAPATPPTDPADLLEDPDAWARNVVPRILDEVVATRSQAEQRFNTELIRHTAAMMDNDPLFKDRNLGNAVVEEIQKGFGGVNKTLPPAVASQLLLHSALASVVRRSVGQKKPALADNRPASGPTGSVRPPAVPARAAKPVKLSSAAQSLVKRWNYSPEDVEKVFGEQ